METKKSKVVMREVKPNFSPKAGEKTKDDYIEIMTKELRPLVENIQMTAGYLRDKPSSPLLIILNWLSSKGYRMTCLTEVPANGLFNLEGESDHKTEIYAFFTKEGEKSRYALVGTSLEDIAKQLLDGKEPQRVTMRA